MRMAHGVGVEPALEVMPEGASCLRQPEAEALLVGGDDGGAWRSLEGASGAVRLRGAAGAKRAR